MTDAELIKLLRSIDHMNVDDCFLQSYFYSKAADRIEELQRENEQLRKANSVMGWELNRLRKANSDMGWELNPDRMGGQFTEEEKNRSGWL